MHTSQLGLFVSLMNLTQEGDTFYFQDFDLEGYTYRVFNYRLSSYSEFLKPSALECRGIMFELAENHTEFTPVRLASRPMHKFFNLGENPSTMDMDLSNVDTIEAKADGSLISTYTHLGELRLKSKGSLFSEQAVDSMKYLRQNEEFAVKLRYIDDLGWTVNMEWCAPHNRIVIGYLVPHLKVLNVRHRVTGEYMDRADMSNWFTPDQMIERVDTNDLDPAAFVASIPQMLGDIEGYVARIGDKWFKIKTEKYMSLHHAKDSINNPRRLFEAILDEGIDDLRSMFAHDVVAIQTIAVMEVKVIALHNSMVREVESFHEVNEHLDRKDYAIKGRVPAELTQMYFGLAMNKKIGRANDYKGFLKGKYKELGFRDTSLDKQDEVQAE